MASKNAYEAYNRFKNDILKEGKRALDFAQEHHRKVIVLAGRPYHIDPQINHGIDRLLDVYKRQLQASVLPQVSRPLSI